VAQGALPTEPLAEEGPIWAVSAGLVDGSARLDLDAAEDQRAQADFNFALAGPERLIEIQGTGERRTFAWAEVERLFDLCRQAAGPIQASQARALEG
jgi:ribonuclease PH